ncbi:MAG TPA: amidohydrolase family protein, partial [Miltoncostaeaceae bacterium]|nr:amidohydrolase family protein [Miltoncostaeaceae bacterium]
MGGDAEVRAASGRATAVIDCGGAAIVAGLVDAHAHPFWGARATRGADLGTARTLDEVRALLRAERARVDGDGWVLGHGLRRTAFGEAPVRGDLVAASVDGAPVFATFHDGHAALATPEALRRAGVDGPRAFPDASQVVCDAGGAPTGELREPSAMEVVRAAVPPLGAAARRALYARTLRRFSALGLTGVHVMDSDPDVLGDLAALEEADALPLRVVLALWQQPGDDEDRVARSHRDARRGGRLWRTGAAKFFLDGVIGSGTAWLGTPDARGRRGGPFWEDVDAYRARVHAFAADGVACVTHAIGDAAVACALEVYAGAPRAPRGPRAVRHRIEHLELVRPEDVRRLGALGVVAGVQPAHLAAAHGADGDALTALLGPERMGRAWPYASLAAAGAVLALGSDWPVAPADPLLGMS